MATDRVFGLPADTAARANSSTLHALAAGIITEVTTHKSSPLASKTPHALLKCAFPDPTAESLSDKLDAIVKAVIRPTPVLDVAQTHKLKAWNDEARVDGTATLNSSKLIKVVLSTLSGTGFVWDDTDTMYIATGDTEFVTHNQKCQLSPEVAIGAVLLQLRLADIFQTQQPSLHIAHRGQFVVIRCSVFMATGFNVKETQKTLARVMEELNPDKSPLDRDMVLAFVNRAHASVA